MTEATLSRELAESLGKKASGRGHSIETALMEFAAVALLVVAYSPYLIYDYAYHLDYYMLAVHTDYDPGNRMYSGFLQNFFVFAEAPYLIRIGRLLNAILVSVQSHFSERVEDYRYLRGFYLIILILSYLWLARIFARHFRLSPAGARMLALLLALSPPLQQGVFMSTFSAPLFAAFWTATSSYLLFARHFDKAAHYSKPAIVLKSIPPMLLMIVSLSCYSPMSMFFAALALLEVISGVRVGPNAANSARSFTVHATLFILVSVALYFVIDRIIFHLVFADTPAIMRVKTTQFYTFSLTFMTSLSGFANRIYNFWICYHNAAGLWDQDTHATTLAAVTVLALLAVLQPPLRMAIVRIMHLRSRVPVPWRITEKRTATVAICKLVLFVLTVLPFLVPDTRAEWDNGYRDSFRTLPAIEAALIFLLYDFFRQIPFTLAALGGSPNSLPSRLKATKIALGAGAVGSVIVAASLSYRTMDVGSRWANTQLQFYQAFLEYMKTDKVSELVLPCGNGDRWLWDSPTIRGEYGYTSINWQMYLKHILPADSPSKGMKLSCGWENTHLESRSYVRKDGGTLFVDYRRFINDYARFTTQEVYLPFRHQGVLFPNILEAGTPNFK